ncbi:DUF2161 domain-containing phosphodiesterase [Marispirochaeta sp.]|jgi:hypothetical protein|uniref:DUF2161 domain-containing phosphodiesterase n=1 Tax=Marispirochaeta sp. TaxID=2038653 RepID=UPI0029C6ABEB|nr:DUF2161 domain-containing phosphodiesterase [Marispirochaeta sp.]
MQTKPPRKETALYPPVKAYLEELGYTVRGEAAGLDVAAVIKNGAGEELIAVELKNTLSIKLLAQAVERQDSADGVYLALPAEGSSFPQKLRPYLKLIRRLGLGLLLVRFMSRRIRVDPVIHPGKGSIRRNKRRRAAILREVRGRSGDHTPGGTRGKVVTAYREEALLIAVLLKKHEELSPAACIKLGGPQKAGRMLQDNHYNWFQRVRHGVYSLSGEGETGLKEYAAVVRLIRKNAHHE